jgi:hypothetical protein
MNMPGFGAEASLRRHGRDRGWTPLDESPAVASEIVPATAPICQLFEGTPCSCNKECKPDGQGGCDCEVYIEGWSRTCHCIFVAHQQSPQSNLHACHWYNAGVAKDAFGDCFFVQRQSCYDDNGMRITLPAHVWQFGAPITCPSHIGGFNPGNPKTYSCNPRDEHNEQDVVNNVITGQYAWYEWRELPGGAQRVGRCSNSLIDCRINWCTGEVGAVNSRESSARDCDAGLNFGEGRSGAHYDALGDRPNPCAFYQGF